MSINLKIKELRQEKGLTQKQLAEQINSTNKNIWAYENIGVVPSVETLIKLADIFDCSLQYLIGLTEEYDDVTIHQSNHLILTPEEQNLLNDFRSLPREERKQVAEYTHYLTDKRGIKNIK